MKFENLPFENKFDFDVGYLVKSPCKICDKRNLFPKCIDTCKVIDKIQTYLTGIVQCYRTIQ